ncbi:acyl-[acyl-carrier-protein] thioesterase [Candidatus Clostridium radicumherbarum]|uniref:Acyl-[acyl-carrier-protein] thioesterase n=1 Tax=Candidatus Clostridium radicumherbarum TaxID=3381662 RepID=A0ABW8TYB6_9CLOT
MSGFVYEKEYEIHYYEVDYKKRVLITSIVDYLEDSATKQSDELGIGMDYLVENNLGWVLYKWNIHMYKYPVYGEKILIRTCPCAMKKFYAYRTFELLNSNGETLGKAESVWFLLNIEKRRPVRVSEDILSAYGLTSNDDKPLEIENIKSLENYNYEKQFSVRYSDIDTNRHVNNEKYIAWAIETLPLDTVLNYTLKNIKVTYEKETIYGEDIRVLTEIEQGENNIICNHKILNKEEKELTLLKTTWEKI